jgi:hypothetical protein
MKIDTDKPLEYRIDEFMSKSGRMKDLEGIIHKVLSHRTRGVSKTTKMIIQKYQSSQSVEGKLNCIMGGIITLISGITGDTGLQSRGIKISKVSNVSKVGN